MMFASGFYTGGHKCVTHTERVTWYKKGFKYCILIVLLISKPHKQ